MLERIRSILTDAGYEVTPGTEGILTICEPESGVSLRAALEGDVLYFTIACLTVDAAQLTPPVLRKMLDAKNGISTSGFQLYETTTRRVVVSLNNFCKLQSLEDDDQDDILSCVAFLLADVLEARALLSEMSSVSS